MYFFIAVTYVSTGLFFYKIYLFHLVLLLVLGATPIFISMSKFKSADFILRKSNLFVTIWFLFAVFSNLWSEDKVLSSFYSIIIFFIFSIFYIVNNFITNQKKLEITIKILFTLFIIELFLSLLESYTSFRWPFSPLSKYSYIFGVNQEVEFSIDKMDYLFSMPTGFRANPNNLSIVLTMFLPFVLALKKIHYRILGSLSIVICIINSSSRGVLIAFFLGIILFYGLKKMKFLFAIFIVSIFSLFMLISFEAYFKNNQNEKIREGYSSIEVLLKYIKFNEIGSDGGASLDVRKALIHNGIQSFKNNPILGIGAGNSTILSNFSIHNFWLEILVDYGIILFLFFLYFYFSTIYKLFRVSKYSKNEYLKEFSYCFFISLLITALSIVVASSVIYLLPFWLMLAISISLINVDKNQNI
jgi:teichuronic acid biosynthesis protein TuaE